MKALYNISYGVYILTVKDQKHSGCVINTLLQVTSNPCRVSITVNKDNYTTSIIEKTGVCNVSILDKNADFELIKRFGFSSGRVENKFDGFNDYMIAQNGVSYITKNTNAYMSLKIVSKIDVGTHITYIADVEYSEVLGEIEPLTYAYYIKNVKPQVDKMPKKVYVCRVCGYVYDGDILPDDFICPICKHGADVFEIKGENTIEEKKEKKQSNSKKKFYCPVCGYEEDGEEGENKTCVLCGAQMILKD